MPNACLFERCRFYLSATESWDRREDNLKKRGHLLTTAELKRRGITRYDAEMLLSQGLCLPEPKSSFRSPAARKSRLKSSCTPKRFSGRTPSRVVKQTPRSAWKAAAAKPRSGLVRRGLRQRSGASRKLKFPGGRRSHLGTSLRAARLARSRRAAPKSEPLDSDAGGSSGASSICGDGKLVASEMALSMSCDVIGSSGVRSLMFSETVLTPSKLRVRPRSSQDCMPLLKKEAAPPERVLGPAPGGRSRLGSPNREDMPVLEKEHGGDLAAGISGWSAAGKYHHAGEPAPGISGSSNRRRCQADVADRRFGYDTREWRVPKLTIRRRRASGNSAGNSGGPVSATASALIYEVLPASFGGGRASVESQPTSDDSSLSDHRSTTTAASSSPDSFSPSCFYHSGTAGGALKRLRLKFGKESVAIDVGRN